MPGNNFRVRVDSDKKDHFLQAFDLFTTEHKKVVGYKIVDNKKLILYWTKTDRTDMTAFPYEFTLSQAAEFAWGWLEHAEYEPEPDIDGSNHKGFTVYNDAWGHIGREWQAFVAIEPVWQMYGK